MSAITCWLNTSANKPSVWAKPKATGVITENIFVNLESNDAMDALVAILRAAFEAKVSYEITVDIESIQRSKSGSFFVKSDLATMLNTMVETVRVETKPVAPETMAKADAILAQLAARRVDQPAQSDTLSF